MPTNKNDEPDKWKYIWENGELKYMLSYNLPDHQNAMLSNSPL